VIEEEAEEAMLQEITMKEKMKEVLQTGAEVQLKTPKVSEGAEVDMPKVDNVEDTRTDPHHPTSDQRPQAHQEAVHQWSSRRTTTRDLLSTSRTFVSK
jgi:hypothetical protein